MRCYRNITLLLLAAVAITIVAQAESDANLRKSVRSQADQLLAAYSAKDLNRARSFYDKNPQNVYFDIAPLEYRGVDAYMKGVTEVLKPYRTINLRLRDDFEVHRSGSQLWSTVTFDMSGVLLTGNKFGTVGRWTAIWQLEGSRWLIVHEHLSLPNAETPHEANLDPVKQR